jgi:hypothetical protein
MRTIAKSAKIAKGSRVWDDLNFDVTTGVVIYANGRIANAPAARVLFDDGTSALVAISALSIITNLLNVA